MDLKFLKENWQKSPENREMDGYNPFAEKYTD